MEFFVGIASVIAVALTVFVGSHFGGSYIESILRRGMESKSIDVVSVTPGRNAKPAEDISAQNLS